MISAERLRAESLYEDGALDDVFHTPDRPAWHALAACRGVGTNVFFEASNYTTARELCKRCPVARDCQTAAKSEIFGVWAAESPRQRRSRRRASTPR
ncbi:MAG: WhiB family transcriptional regulator [Acidimicrobiales bacterium]